MRLDDLDPSKNVRDQGRGGGGSFGGGSGGGGLGLLLGFLPMLLGRKMGCGTILLIGGAALAFMYFSSGSLQLADGAGGGGFQSESSGANVACDTAEERFACQVLASTEQTWSKLFQANGETYRPTTLTFYDQSGQSGCGAAQAAMGPFYCPADQGVYLDTSFFREMATRMGAKGDFAQAYVIAHEVGHHIQNLTGVAAQVRKAQGSASKAEGNALQVRMELQADCYAGVWAAQNADRMEPGDVEEGLNAAHAIGDDTLMRGAGQQPVESMFTHGSSEQRMAWLRKGMQTGDPSSCDTFAAGAV
ncbi:neutral zinc metallopeptidase [uncultured Parasphingorhabdus sp.]|uniref:KPN_02809 family neutral zinc metallopeptidase n=1 Tax=uncultured Parasphingorhabdus sp. TaxID=2709694 RepID=UPI0030DC40F5|tara:strand:+ start:3433 stop:4344 length:912 start_codon:yes stop_codon:yes gene_type:complete